MVLFLTTVNLVVSYADYVIMCNKFVRTEDIMFAVSMVC